MPALPPVPTDRDGAVAWVDRHLGHLVGDAPSPGDRAPTEPAAAGRVRASPVRGGQAAADAALAALDVTGYAARRSQVLPESSRGASRLSPYIRHGLLPLPVVWDAVAGAPPRDRSRYRDELLWQEYARHVYARVGRDLAAPLRFAPPTAPGGWSRPAWPDDMACTATTTAELHEDGWLVNQTRMWLSSQWAVRAGADWREGEREMYRHLIDGSPAANLLGWQWTIGTGTGKVYGFSRWQVEKRAPGLCATCPLRSRCPIESWPDAAAGPRVEPPAGLAGGPTDAGPTGVETTGEPEAVWLTAESLGEDDPALRAHPELPAVFVFDEPLLRSLRLAGKRLVFLAETLAELGAQVHLGDPVEELAGRRLATTWTFPPGWKRRAARLDVVELHPWPWLRRPGAGSLRSFSAWAR